MRASEIARLLGVPFHDQQLRAIEAPADAPLQIVAGAGSGKTTVMAARVVWLVAGGHVRPEQVLGLTFTNKAASGLATKVREALELLGASPLAESLEPTVSTYHAYAGQLMREHGLRVGIEPEARLLADATRFQIAGRVLRSYDGPLPELSHVPAVVLGEFVGLEGTCSDHLVDPADVARYSRELAATLDALAEPLAQQKGKKGAADALRGCATACRERADLCALVQAYRAAKRALDVVDFGDQISIAVEIARTSAAAVEQQRDRYRAVLLDEYQDTSVAQAELLRMLFGDGRAVTAVGDPCQAIYGWRGASVANLYDFQERFRRRDGTPAECIDLTVSQRSGGRLLTAANVIVEQLTARLGRRAVRVRPLEARSDRILTGTVRVARLERFDDELAWLADQVRSAIADGTPAGEVAVLLRSWRNTGAVHQALTAVGIPVEVVGLGGLLALPEVADVVATLEVLDDPTANAALLRLLTGPRWMLGSGDLRALGAHAAASARPDVDADALDPLDGAAQGADPSDVTSLLDAVDDTRRGLEVPGLSDEARARLRELGRELHGLRRHVGDPLIDLITRVISVTGLDVEAAASPDTVTAGCRASLAAFIDVAASYLQGDTVSDTQWSGTQWNVAASRSGSLHGFLAYLHAAQTYDRGFDAPPPHAADSVQILTVHKAKGLEWDVVVLPDLTDTVFPSSGRGRLWPRAAAELPWPLRQDRASLPSGPDWAGDEKLTEFADSCANHIRAEEDRLAYVAFTRAREQIIASSHRWGPVQKKPRQPSPYLDVLRRHAETIDPGHGVDRWVEDDDVTTNPFLEGISVPWPAQLDPAALARRTAAAREVERFRTAPGGCDTVPLAPPDAARYADYDREIDLLLAEARAARSNEVEVPLPASLTASQVLLLQADADGLARELARPLPRRPAPAARRGTAFHAWVEEHFALAPLLDDDALIGAADEGLDDHALRELKQAFLATPWSDRVPYAVEVGFAVVLGGRAVRGRIDAVYQLSPGEPDGCRWHVIDWKTGSEPADPLQLAIYRAAWAQRCGCPPEQVRASFLTVRTGALLTPADLPDGTALDILLTAGAAAAG